jgi:hypothetical protein
MEAGVQVDVSGNTTTAVNHGVMEAGVRVDVSGNTLMMEGSTAGIWMCPQLLTANAMSNTICHDGGEVHITRTMAKQGQRMETYMWKKHAREESRCLS